jgi:hypothetical protein
MKAAIFFSEVYILTIITAFAYKQNEPGPASCLVADDFEQQ